MGQGIVVLGIEGFEPPADMGKQAVHMMVNNNVLGFHCIALPIECCTMAGKPSEAEAIQAYKGIGKKNGWDLSSRVGYQFLGQRGQYEIIVLFPK